MDPFEEYAQMLLEELQELQKQPPEQRNQYISTRLGQMRGNLQKSLQGVEQRKMDDFNPQHMPEAAAMRDMQEFDKMYGGDRFNANREYVAGDAGANDILMGSANRRSDLQKHYSDSRGQLGKAMADQMLQSADQAQQDRSYMEMLRNSAARYDGQEIPYDDFGTGEMLGRIKAERNKAPMSLAKKMQKREASPRK